MVQRSLSIGVFFWKSVCDTESSMREDWKSQSAEKALFPSKPIFTFLVFRLLSPIARKLNVYRSSSGLGSEDRPWPAGRRSQFPAGHVSLSMSSPYGTNSGQCRGLCTSRALKSSTVDIAITFQA